MIRFTQIVLLVLLSMSVALPTAEAQKRKKKSSATQSEAAPKNSIKMNGGPSQHPHNLTPQAKVNASKESMEKWIKVSNKQYAFSFAHPEDWAINQTEHPDPDELLPDSTVNPDANDFNAIEVNREAFEQGLPYVLVYAVKKQPQTWEDYGSRLEKDLGLFAAHIIGADTSYKFKGHPGYDVTYESPSYRVRVRSIVFYANGLRYGIMYTTSDEIDPKAFKQNMLRFERLLETLEVGS